MCNFILTDNMDEEVYCCLGCIFAIFLIFAGFSVVDTISHWGGTNYDADKIYLSEFENHVTNYSFELKNGKIEEDYLYSVYYDLHNISSSLIGGDIVTYLYSGDVIDLSDEVQYNSNNSTSPIEEKYINGFYPVSAYFHINNFTNVTHCVIVIIKDGEIIFNTTHSFNMNNYEKYESSVDVDGNDSDDESSSTSSSITYVASVNSDKFHEPSCSQAKRIKDGNRITFSSRDDAINAGYSPCGICYP